MRNHTGIPGKMCSNRKTIQETDRKTKTVRKRKKKCVPEDKVKMSRR